MVEKLQNDGFGQPATINTVWAMALEIFGDEEATRAFFSMPHPMLGGRTPFELSHSGEAGKIEAILGRLLYGCAA